MANNFAAIANLLFCPDDGASLSFDSGHLDCSSCARRFPIQDDNVAEILPRRPRKIPPSVNSEYREGYLRAFEQGYRNDQTSLAWGAEETVSEAWARKRLRQVTAVKRLVTEETRDGESILCDVAAGAGYYTLPYARCFRFVLHCDLSADNLSYTSRKARALGVENIVFLRADYFALPFRRSLDRIICLDTLIRGEAHDGVLLASIVQSLKPGGTAVVDFHNWWHNPLRRVGVLRDNFLGNKSYKRRRLREFLANAGVHQFEIKPFVQEVDPDQPTAKLLTHLLPPTRFMVRLRSGSKSRQADLLVGTAVTPEESGSKC